MTDDPTRPPDLKAIWKDQRLEIPPVAEATLRRNARRLQRRRVWTLIRETLGVVLLVVMVGFYARIRSLQPGPMDLSEVVTETGMGLLVVYVLFYVCRVFVLFRPRRVPDDAVACLAFHRHELERQRDLARGLRWAIIPLIPFETLMLVGIWMGQPAPGRAAWLHHLTTLASAVIMLESIVLAWLWHLHRADRWQDQIDALDTLGKEERR